MKLLALIKKLRKESVSIMIVPHSGEKVKQIQFKKFFFYTFLSCFLLSSIIICASLAFLIKNNTYLSKNLSSKDAIIEDLSSNNEIQAEEIISLKNKINSISEKLIELNELEEQVRSIMGIKKNNKSLNSESKLKEVSRAGIPRIDLNSTDEELDLQLKTLSMSMDSENANLEQLIKDVNDKKDFLNCKPDKRPTYGRISSRYGYRFSPITKKRQFHKGLDIANRTGTNIVSSANGIVVFSGSMSGYGNTIIISHGYGYRTVYGHNYKNLVKKGDKVTKGQLIAKMGNTGRSTGPHLHFEIHYNGKRINPIRVYSN